MWFFRQEYWSRLTCTPPGDLPDPGIKPTPPTWQADSLLLSRQGSPGASLSINIWILSIWLWERVCQRSFQLYFPYLEWGWASFHVDFLFCIVVIATAPFSIECICRSTFYFRKTSLSCGKSCKYFIPNGSMFLDFHYDTFCLKSTNCATHQLVVVAIQSCTTLCEPMHCSMPGFLSFTISCQGCHPTISSSVIPFSSCLQSFTSLSKLPNFSVTHLINKVVILIVHAS